METNTCTCIFLGGKVPNCETRLIFMSEQRPDLDHKKTDCRWLIQAVEFGISIFHLKKVIFLVLTWPSEGLRDYKKATLRAAKQPGFHFMKGHPWQPERGRHRKVCQYIPHLPLKSTRKPPFVTKPQINHKHVPTNLGRQKTQSVYPRMSVFFSGHWNASEADCLFSPQRWLTLDTHPAISRCLLVVSSFWTYFPRRSTCGLQRVTAHGTATTLCRANDEQRDTSSGVREHAWPRLATPSGNTHTPRMKMQEFAKNISLISK